MVEVEIPFSSLRLSTASRSPGASHHHHHHHRHQQQQQQQQQAASAMWCVYLAPPFFFLLPGRPRLVLDSMMSCDCFLRPCRVTTSSSSPLASSSIHTHTHRKTRVPGLSCGVVRAILRLAILEHRLVTDTDRQTQGRGIYSTSIASRGKNTYKEFSDPCSQGELTALSRLPSWI